ncbi:MAG: hypothetical protein RLZZ440_1517 [Planctomycetota bacterium]
MRFLHRTRFLFGLAWLGVAFSLATAAADDAVRPVRVRVQWGGGTPRSWTGCITVSDERADADPPAAAAIAWQTLCREADAAALAHATPTGIEIHQPRPIASDGVELTIHDWPRARLRVELGPTGLAGAGVVMDVAVSDVLDAPQQQPLGADGNRLTIAAAPSEPLQVTLADADPATGAATTVRRPGDILRFRVDPLIPLKPGVGDVELRLRLSPARQEAPLDTQATKLVPLAPPAGPTPVGGRQPTPFAGVDFELSLPAEEGVYEVALEAVELRGLRWTKPLASRVIQVVAIAADPPAVDDTPWEPVYELDPRSPRLHERLRRLPGRGLAAIPLPAVPLPAMPRPSLPLPRLPEVPVALPDVSAMVPRLSGLLTSGHSVVAAHPLGPVLNLPPAAEADRPSWEAIAIAGAREGLPHAVEIVYPTDQRATLAVCVLEPDAAGGSVEVRHAGGFTVDNRWSNAAAEQATHRFVFWPTCRTPVIVLANPDTDSPALVSRVRVLAGPRRLERPAASRPAGPLPVGSRRLTYALFPEPDLARLAGGGQRATDDGRGFADWLTQFAAVRHAAELAASDGLGGVVATVFADGAAAWPTSLTRSAPRWDAGGDGPLDPAPKDILTALERVCGREGLSLIPAVRFDAALPALEAERATGAAAGIVCVGGDGRPRQLPGGPHYNILDPRVQQAVERIVADLAGRLRGSQTTTGIAIELPHDGWLHLPGLAWGLDDVTFGRFLTAIGEPEPQPAADADRFAERARLVRGPLRQQWLSWRMSELIAFHARLAAVVAGPDGRWPLYLMPTTLFTAGDLARRFEPRAASSPDQTDDLIREAGLVTTLPETAAHGGRLVFMSPQVVAEAASLSERGVVAAANRSLALARAAVTAADRGSSIVVRPLSLDLSGVVPHGPFGTAAAGGPASVRILPASAAGDRELAATLVAADASVVFDMRPALATSVARPAARQAWEALPAGPLPLVGSLPAPLVVRSRVASDRTWLEIVNAAPAPATARLTLGDSPAAVIDAVSAAAFPCEHGGVGIPLDPWAVRTIVIDGSCRIEAAAIDYDQAEIKATAARIERLRQRLGVLHVPEPLDVLDNPGFELGLAQPAGSSGQPPVTGWELLESRRGSLQIVPGIPSATDPDGLAAPSRGLEFSSFNGLSTLRSNPFAPPKTGRISVAAWLRVKPGDQQPPLRIAVEGVEDGREYYRFAAIGGLAGGRPLTGEWSLFVLQVDDLPPGRVDSMRVRFDLLGPGGVQIDDVSVYDLAFDETERTGLAQEIARIDHRFKQGDVGAAIVGLTGHWPAFLEAFVSDEAVAAREQLRSPAASPGGGGPPPPERRQGALDRFRSWWQ